MENREQIIIKWLEEEMANITYGIGQPIRVYEFCEKMIKRIKALPSGLDMDFEKWAETWTNYYIGKDSNSPVWTLVYETAKEFAKWQKEQIIKNAKSGVINKDYFIRFDDGTWIDFDPTMQLKPAFDVKVGEKVKVIIIKEQ